MSHSHTSASRTTLGFWVYLMSDCVLFASLFATYAVLHGNTFDGPTAADIFSLPFVLLETMVLLTSSFTCGLAFIALHRKSRGLFAMLLLVTAGLGLIFVGLEISEFVKLVSEDAGPDRSAFLSSFFTLVGTHGVHVSIGVLWMLFLLAQTFFDDITETIVRRAACLVLFWHFLDIVWIFIFTLVYLFGAL